MTPTELRALAEEATPGPWVTGRRYPESLTVYYTANDAYTTRLRTPEDAQLAALAPQLAVLCAEMAEAARDFLTWPDVQSPDEQALRQALARLEALERP